MFENSKLFKNVNLLGEVKRSFANNINIFISRESVYQILHSLVKINTFPSCGGTNA